MQTRAEKFRSTRTNLPPYIAAQRGYVDSVIEPSESRPDWPMLLKCLQVKRKQAGQSMATCLYKGGGIEMTNASEMLGYGLIVTLVGMGVVFIVLIGLSYMLDVLKLFQGWNCRKK